jgi:tRNA(Arg) A34 adenosine deaminase TadA
VRRSLVITLPAWLPALLAETDPLPDLDARMRLAVELARRNVVHGTGGPFGALVAESDTGRIVAAGVNLVEPLANSVLHAETVAIMFAERALGRYSLGGAGRRRFELVTSSAPCAMCVGAVFWSGVPRLVCGARTEDVRAVGFDEGPVFPESLAYLERRGVEIVRDVLREEARRVLEDYRARGGTIYGPS